MSSVVPRWAPRLKKGKIRRLYESEATGLIDEDLLEDVFLDMVLRCESMMKANAFSRGEPVDCPACGDRVEQKSGTDRIRCPRCKWHTTTDDYHTSCCENQVYPGGLLPAIQEFLINASVARTATDKMLMIDRIIHCFHSGLTTEPGRPAVNLLLGKQAGILAFLDDLARGEPKNPVMRRRIDEWRGTIREMDARRAQKEEQTRAKRQRGRQVKMERAKRDALRKKSRQVK
jgi:hypothetical protein